MQVSMEDAITLDRKSFEALAADSRVRILKSLANRRKTLSELSQEIGLSNSTMKEHLDVLVSAGLAVQMDEGRKWKYYELTRKGKGIFVPAHREVKVLIMLAISLLLVVSSFWNFAAAFSTYSAPLVEGNLASAEAAPLPMIGGAAAPPSEVETAGVGEGVQAKAASAEGNPEPLMMGARAVSAEDNSSGLMAAEESASTMAANGEASVPVQEKQFPFVESILLAGSIAIFIFALYYAKKET